MKTFFKQLFCKHKFPSPLFSSDCKIDVECSKCGKTKTVPFHDYKEIQRLNITTTYGSVLANDYVEHSIKKVYECKKCGDIFSKEYTI